MSIKTWIGPKRASRSAARAYGLALAALALACCGESAGTQAQVLPSDAKPLCTFEPGEFAGWFETGAVTLNGAVKPKDSLNFAPAGICSFHKWSEQMFLWLTSPAGDARVFQSPDFYRVSARGDDHMRTLEKNTAHKNDPALRTSKPIEHGQPGHRFVLMARNRSLVYYATYVNEVYAYFLTGTKTGGITPQPTHFPIRRQELKDIIDYGASRGMTIGIDDPKAQTLVLTVKTAWIEAARLVELGFDPNKYVTVSADIPHYAPDASNETLTPIPGGPQKALLALVGMHIAGSATGNPKMIWATFEHIDNTPMAPYSYFSTTSQDPQEPQWVNPSPTGTWLFSASNCTGSPNVPRMHARDLPLIKALPGKKIEPSDTCRENAWGMDARDGLVARSERNTQVIAINNTVIGMLPTGDARKNYLLVGTIWGLGAGSDRLANTTLETFDQKDNCFDCHKGDLHGGELHHMFGSTKPLPVGTQ